MQLVLFLSADNIMVARLLEVRRRFPVVFLKLKSRVFVKICFHFFLSWVEFGVGGKFVFKGNAEFIKPPLLLDVTCNCKHSIERKILLSRVNRNTPFWILWSLFLPSKQWTLRFCWILKGSYSKKIRKPELTHFLLDREAKALQKSLSVYLETDFCL